MPNLFSKMRFALLLLVAVFLASCDSGPSKPAPPEKGDFIVLADVRATTSRVEYVFDRVLLEGPGQTSPYKKGDLLASEVLPGPGVRLPDQMIFFLEKRTGGSFVPTESQSVYEGKIPVTGLSVADFEAQLKKGAAEHGDAARP
jgi:hypothetical protein